MTFLIASVFAFVWAGMGALEKITAPRTGATILKAVLREPYQDSIDEALKKQSGSPIAVNHDLINFSVDRTAAQDINIAQVLAGQRAVDIYDHGLPKDPGRGRTETILPRSVLALFTAQRHEYLGTAKTAALIGLATAFLLCAVIGMGATRFLLPGSAALLGFLLLRYHIRLVNFWLEKNAPGALLFRGQLRVASFEPERQLLFVTITLLVAGVVFRTLRGPMRAIMRGSEKREKREQREQTPA
jgi:hypothetical protein